MTQQPLAASKTKPFGPNVSQFLAQALPAAAPKASASSILVVGELHTQIDHVNALSGNIKDLRDPKKLNVGLLARESPIFLNVLYWALQDNKLPVSKSNENKYLHSMITATSSASHETNVLAAFEATKRMLNSGAKFIAHDARYSIDVVSAAPNSEETVAIWDAVAPFLPKTTKERQALRDKPELLKKWVSQTLERKPVIDEKLMPRGIRPEDIKFGWLISEIQQMIDAHPDYKARLLAIMKIANKAKEQGLPEDAQSAAIIAAHAMPGSNVLVWNGLSHIGGVYRADMKTQGTFASHLERLEFKVTPVVIASEKELSRFKGPLGWERINSNFIDRCAAKAPMHLLVVDKDVVLDVSSHTVLQSVQSQPNVAAQAKSVAQQLLKSNAHLTCDNPALPTTAACARDEAKGKAGPGPCLPGGR